MSTFRGWPDEPLFHGFDGFAAFMTARLAPYDDWKHVGRGDPRRRRLRGLHRPSRQRPGTLYLAGVDPVHDPEGNRVVALPGAAGQLARRATPTWRLRPRAAGVNGQCRSEARPELCAVPRSPRSGSCLGGIGATNGSSVAPRSRRSRASGRPGNRRGFRKASSRGGRCGMCVFPGPRARRRA